MGETAMNGVCTDIKSRWEILRLAKNKKIVLFGTGKKAKDFLSFHLEDFLLAAVVDNDVQKQNHMLGDVIPELKDRISGQLIIKPVISLQNFGNDVFVLVANAKPEPLVRQLQEIGIKHILTFKEWWYIQDNMHLNQAINSRKIIFFMYMHGAHEKEITKQLLRYRDRL